MALGRFSVVGYGPCTFTYFRAHFYKNFQKLKFFPNALGNYLYHFRKTFKIRSGAQLNYTMSGRYKGSINTSMVHLINHICCPPLFVAATSSLLWQRAH